MGNDGKGCVQLAAMAAGFDADCPVSVLDSEDGWATVSVGLYRDGERAGYIVLSAAGGEARALAKLAARVSALDNDADVVYACDGASI